MSPSGPAFDRGFDWDPAFECYAPGVLPVRVTDLVPRNEFDELEELRDREREEERDRVKFESRFQGELFETHTPAELEDPTPRSCPKTIPPSKQARADASS